MRVWENQEIYVTVVQKDKNIWQVKDFPCPYDGRVDTKALEKNTALPWFGTRIIPLVIDALGTTHIKLKEIDIETQITELQKTVILKTARIRWKVLEV